MWAQSATIGLTGAIKYPDSYRTIFFENLKEDPDNYISSLCDWIGIPYEKERMLNMVDYTRKQNSAFSKNNNNTSITRDNIDRKKYLTDYEINTLKKMACTNFVNATEYGKEEVIINWKIKKTQDVNIKEYSKMVCSIKKSLISPLNLRQAILFYSHELFIFDNIKNIISIINNIIKSKTK